MWRRPWAMGSTSVHIKHVMHMVTVLETHRGTRTRHVTSHMRPARCSSTNGRTTYSPNSDASAVRACAVTLNKEIRVCRGGGDLVAKETERSARSKEECVQSGPRSRDFAVKDAAEKNKDRQEEAERPLSLGAACSPEPRERSSLSWRCGALLRGESRL